MASNRLKRTMRGALAATAVVAVIGATPSVADPAPPTSPVTTPTMPTGTPLQVYQQLSQQAETLDQQLMNAQDQQTQAQNTLNAANADLAKAQQALQAAENTEEGLRDQVDQLTDAQYEGARFGQLSALLTGSSAKDYLDKATMLQDMAEDSSKTLDGMQAATDAATAAQQRAAKDQQTAQDATNKANDLVNQIHQAQNALAPLLTAAHNAYLKVAPGDLKNHVDPSQFIVPGGAAGVAIRAAEGFIGTRYVYGGTTPAGFDCSGLMQYVWREAGVNLPRTAAEQQQVGTRVSGESNLEAGDLVFFGSPAYHVGMYLGNGYMIDAPRTGEDVQIQQIFSGFSYGRRIS